MSNAKLSNIAPIFNAELFGCDQEFSGVSIDSRTLKPGNVFIALKGENFDGHDFIEAAAKVGAAAAIVSKPGSYPLPTLQVADTHQALIQWATYHREQFNIPVIAITGSCGKTTTRALTASILNLKGKTLASQSSFNNDIGLPLTVLQLSKEHDYFVQEVGANHLGEIAHLMKILKPTISVITCAEPVHLEGFGSLDNIASAKAEIYEGLMSDGIAVINVDDYYSDFWKEKAKPRRVITFGTKHPADTQAKSVQLNEGARASFDLCMDHEKFAVQLQLIGQHNVQNALAAAAIAQACGVAPATIAQGLEQAQAEKMRLQAKKGIKSTHVIDDSYNANPVAMVAALEVLRQHAEPRVFVIGDMRELGSEADRFHAELGEQAKKYQVQSLYCYGPLTKFAAEKFGVNAHWFEDIAALINHLQESLKPGSTILVKGSRSMGMDRVVKALVV